MRRHGQRGSWTVISRQVYLWAKEAYWLMRRTSTVLMSNSSKYGKDAKPSWAGCMPVSSWGR
jgi:hypothetical protein